jgi:hypothetical protein
MLNRGVQMKRKLWSSRDGTKKGRRLRDLFDDLIQMAAIGNRLNPYLVVFDYFL